MAVELRKGLDVLDGLQAELLREGLGVGSGLDIHPPHEDRCVHVPAAKEPRFRGCKETRKTCALLITIFLRRVQQRTHPGPSRHKLTRERLNLHTTEYFLSQLLTSNGVFFGLILSLLRDHFRANFSSQRHIFGASSYLPMGSFSSFSAATLGSNGTHPTAAP